MVVLVQVLLMLAKVPVMTKIKFEYFRDGLVKVSLMLMVMMSLTLKFRGKKS